MTEASTVTWVLSEEPTLAVFRVLEMLELRAGSDPSEVLWMCPVDGPEV